MKLVREHINEKFVEDSDPIHDMGIGRKKLIIDWLNKFNVPRHAYVINKDFTIDVDDDISFTFHKIKEFPDFIQFNNVDGNFYVNNCDLISFRGCPYYINGLFGCEENNITSLDFCPKIVSGMFFFSGNSIEFTKAEIAKVCLVHNGDNDKRYIET